MSQHLAGLEAALGGRLFVRKPRRMELTGRGQALYSRIADAVEKLESVATQNTGLSEPLRLGAPHEYFEARIVGQLARAPELSLTVELGSSAALLDRLESGALDAVVSTVKRASPSLAYRGLFEESFWLVAAPGTRAPPVRALPRWLRDQSWIAYGPDLPIIRRFFRQVLAMRPAITPRLTVPDLRAVVRAVELGMGVSVLPDYLCRDAVAAGRLCVVHAPDDPVSNDLWWVTARRAVLDPRIATLFGVLRSDA